MSEFIRVYRKRNILLIIIFIILNAGLFLLSFSAEKEITLTGDELQSYVDGFEEYYDKIKNSSETMLSLNMYREGFAADSIKKTAEIYAENDIQNIRYGDNRGTVLFLQYSLSDIFLAAFMVIISADMLSERKKGLVKAVRSTKLGRGTLYLYRIIILGFSAVLMTILLYGGNYVAVLAKFGGTDTLRNIQSLPEFMQCPYNITIREYIFRMLGMKALVSFLTATVFYLLLSVLGTGLSYTISAVFAAGEFLLYKLVPAVSSLNYFRYINICTAFKYDSYYTECFFLNIFGKAVPVLSVICVISVVTAAAAVVIGYAIHGKRYISEQDYFRKITDRISRAVEKLSFQRTLPGWEMYKLLIKQGGIFFMTAAFLLALSSASKYNYLYRTNYRETEWYNKYHGTITEENVSSAEQEYEKIEKQLDFFRRRLEELISREMTDTVGMQISTTQYNIQKTTERLDALNTVLENMRGGLAYTRRTGHSVDLIRPYSYDLLLQKDNASKNRASLFILIGLVGALSGVFAYDTQNNMKNTIRSSYRGRAKVRISKLLPACIICAVLCTAVHLIQFVQIKNYMGYNDILSPVQSLPFMRDFGIYMSISGYFILMFAVRAVFSCAVGLVCCLISRICPDTASAMGISIFVLAVPSLVSQIIPGADFINAVYLIGGAGI